MVCIGEVGGVGVVFCWLVVCIWVCRFLSCFSFSLGLVGGCCCCLLFCVWVDLVVGVLLVGFVLISFVDLCYYNC